MTLCECPLAGYCERHKVAKGKHWHKLCQTNSDYRDAWDAGRGPGQPRKPLSPEQREKKERIQEAAAKQQRLIGWLSVLRRPGERGAGDTAHRLCMRACRAPDASEALQRLLKQCSCTRVDAVAKLNQQWPW